MSTELLLPLQLNDHKRTEMAGQDCLPIARPTRLKSEEINESLGSGGCLVRIWSERNVRGQESLAAKFAWS